MSMLSSIILIIVGTCFLIKIMPTFLRHLLFGIIALPIVIIVLLLIPGFGDDFGAILFLVIMAVLKLRESRNYVWDDISSGSSGSGYPRLDYSYGKSYDGYVLNKKTGVIHNRWDSSVDTISEHHRREISYSEAQDLINRGTRYRFKQ